MVGMAAETSSGDGGGKRRQGRRLPIPEAAKHDTEQPLGRDVADLAGIAATGRVVTKHDELAGRGRRAGQGAAAATIAPGRRSPGTAATLLIIHSRRPAVQRGGCVTQPLSSSGFSKMTIWPGRTSVILARRTSTRSPAVSAGCMLGPITATTAIHRRRAAANTAIAASVPLTFASYAQAHVDDWIATHRTGLASARLLGDSTAELWILNNLGFGYIHAKCPQAAIDCLRECLPVVRETEDLAALARVLVNLGYALLDIDRDDEAMESLQESLLLFQQLGIRRGEGIALGGLGKAHRRRGQLGDAIAHYERTLDASREASDFVTEGTTLVELSAVRLELGQADAAIHTAMEAVDLYRQTGNRYGHAQAIAILGRAERDRGHPAQARQYWLDAIAIFTELGLPQADEVAASLNALGSVSDRAGRPEQIHIVGPA